MNDPSRDTQKRYEKKAQHHSDRGDYFFKNEQYAEALEEYITASKYFIDALTQEISCDKFAAGGRKYDRGSKVSFCYSVAAFLMKIIDCYQELDRKKIFFLLRDMAETIELLSEYQGDMNVSQLQSYENLKKYMIRYEYAEKPIAKLKQGDDSYDEYFDDNLKKLYQSLNYFYEQEESILPKRKIPGAKNDCFIATAVYETPEHPDLDVFRDFRDNQLLTNSLGTWLVGIYYKIGPSLAQYIASQPTLKKFTHQRLKHLAQWMRK